LRVVPTIIAVPGAQVGALQAGCALAAAAAGVEAHGYRSSVLLLLCLSLDHPDSLVQRDQCTHDGVHGAMNAPLALPVQNNAAGELYRLRLKAELCFRASV